MAKEFTSPIRFDTFRVVSERDGTVALVGGAPSRSLPVDGLGQFHQVWMGDFTALRAPGRYRIVLDRGLASYPFDIGAEVFDRPLRAVQRAFYYQRAFTEVDAAHAEGPWVHGSDAAKAPPGVRQGWHDAGDFSIYSASLNTALFWMLEAYSDFGPSADDTGIPESGNGLPDLLDEARWGLEWLLSVQDASGGFRNTTCQEHYGAYGTNSPETAQLYRNGEVGTLATARAVGTLAYASTVYRKFDPALADRCLNAARRGDAYLKAHPGQATDGPTCPAIRADGDVMVGRHVRMYAAAGLLLATGESGFRQDFEQNYVELDYDPSYLHFNGFAAQLYLRAPAGDSARKRVIRERRRLHADEARADGARQPFRWSPRTHWGSISAAFTRTGTYNLKQCLEDPTAVREDCEQALANIHYALGRNFLTFCYVSGLPGVTQGRTWAFHHWLATLRAEPHDFPGMVAGGPNINPEPEDRSKPWARPIPVWGYWGDPAFPRDATTPFEARYTDNDSWSTNEISLEWQATALYSLYFAQWMAKRPSS
jgi:endoglucanase